MTISYSVTITNDRDPGRCICTVSPTRPTVDGGLLVTEENGRGGAWVWALRPGDTVAIQRMGQPLADAAASENPPPPVPVGGHRDAGEAQDRTGGQAHPTPPRETTRYHAHPTHQIDEGGGGGAGASRLLRLLTGLAGLTFDDDGDSHARTVAQRIAGAELGVAYKAGFKAGEAGVRPRLRLLEGGMTDVLADVQARGVAAHAGPLQIDRWRLLVRDALVALGGWRPDPNL